MAPRPNSIRAMGLKRYLNDTGAEHNLHYYADFVLLVDTPIRPSISKIARYFNVSDQTMTKWLEIYEYEQAEVDLSNN